MAQQHQRARALLGQVHADAVGLDRAACGFGHRAFLVGSVGRVGVRAAWRGTRPPAACSGGAVLCKISASRLLAARVAALASCGNTGTNETINFRDRKSGRPVSGGGGGEHHDDPGRRREALHPWPPGAGDPAGAAGGGEGPGPSDPGGSGANRRIPHRWPRGDPGAVRADRARCRSAVARHRQRSSAVRRARSRLSMGAGSAGST